MMNIATSQAAPWQPDSWRGRAAQQQPVYDDPARLHSALVRLSALPPLVTSWEIERLRRQLALAAQGEAFLCKGETVPSKSKPVRPSRSFAS